MGAELACRCFSSSIDWVMKSWNLTNPKNPIWFIFGLSIIFIVISVTTFFMMRGPNPIKSIGDIGSNIGFGVSGKFGTVTEPLERGLFVLSYKSITGDKDNLQLLEVTSQLREFQTIWDMNFPCAKKFGGVWTLSGPLYLNSYRVNANTNIGKGYISYNGPVLKWDRGIWYGLSSMTWNDLSGQGRGDWVLPAGWYRDFNGMLVVENGPVRWLANKSSDVISMNANRMYIDMDFQEGHMEDVTANLVGGYVKAHVVYVYKNYISWPEPVSFVRNDGWYGSSTGGFAPRSASNNDIKKIEFKEFKAKRDIVSGTELVNADRAVWTKSGLLLEGNVCMERPSDGKRISLKASTILQRNNLGGDFPSDMPIGAIWAGPEATLSWGDKSMISSHHIEGIRKNRQWLISSPSNGRWSNGTFTAGDGRGDPMCWAFSGPILANFGDGFAASSDLLTWENGIFTLTGRPVLLTGFRERLTGHRLVMRNKMLEFPDGIVGTLQTMDEDINIRADRGKVLRTLVNLYGRVECCGNNWRLQADSILVTVNNENIVEKIKGTGTVRLVGRMGEGSGGAILLDLNQKTADWFGKVKAAVGTKS